MAGNFTLFLECKIQKRRKHLWVATGDSELEMSLLTIQLIYFFCSNPWIILLCFQCFLGFDANQSMKLQAFRRKVMYFLFFISILATGIAMLCHFYVAVLNPSFRRDGRFLFRNLSTHLGTRDSSEAKVSNWRLILRCVIRLADSGGV